MKFNKKLIIPAAVVAVLGSVGLYISLKENKIEQKKFAVQKL